MSSENVTAKTKPLINTKNLVISGMFTAIICVMAQIQLPTQPVPFTLVVLAIFLAGALLKPPYAFFSVLAYLLLGAFGLPVFAGFTGGISYLFGKTGGYLMTFPIMAFVISMFYHKARKAKMVWLTVGMIIGLILCYVLGTLWFSYITKISYYLSLTYCVFPFVLFDSIKLIVALIISGTIRQGLTTMYVER